MRDNNSKNGFKVVVGLTLGSNIMDNLERWIDISIYLGNPLIQKQWRDLHLWEQKHEMTTPKSTTQ